MVPDQDVIISCTRCTINVPIGQTTYETNSRNLICFNCYNKLARGLQPDKIIQSACSYKFSRSREFQFGGRCFHCGKAAVQVEETKQILAKDRKSLLDY